MCHDGERSAHALDRAAETTGIPTERTVTDSYRLLVLIYTILDCYSYHFTVAHILYCVLRDCSHWLEND